ncbi:cystathionine beta-lyase family protein involved in aluminum resistance [Desulfosporosinus acidiphilus SJ4]|uniref:Cystathionine beta-lyase family protein involved in aluminum resistance n=1 Tax=Desulfosporosinus acidiphilus (strain DSM 22704 / JCM 16185 / SJ4) TaxID=646529 RepID=I4D7N8_DESAJ|nr:methionine gamma-lyase family protein [Desulfosporosinus acidiphilus]AFM41812.1 cystathionine beta-lyase family protein involved in aluminum resistance [Desulfosporosinus acidiphilus SJ4]
MYPNSNWPEFINKAVFEAENILQQQLPHLMEVSARNHEKVLRAFQEERVSAYHLQGTTGYGLGDSGRETLDRVASRILGTEAALVRGQFVSGTHAIAAALFGVLRPGDEMISVSGTPYDTLEEVIGLRGEGQGSLRDFGVGYQEISLDFQGNIQFELLKEVITDKTKLLTVQRSRGYAWRNSLTIAQLKELVDFVKTHFPKLVIFVDNCYGELVESLEPGDIGADLMAGSLIKNLGGSIAPTGGYVAGRSDLVDLASQRLTAPGVGGHMGATLEWQRLFYQGLFFSPLTVAEALKGAVFSAAFWRALGFEVNPEPELPRTDLIQAVKLGSREKMIAFCQGLQKGSPLDSHIRPVPSGMPGYEDEIIMAGGTFIQGSTSEFSADGPLREPYIAYQQGGISHTYIQMGNILAALNLWQQGLLT